MLDMTLEKRGLLTEKTVFKKLQNEYSVIIDKVNNEQNEYWLGIRNNYAVLYYRAGKILGIDKNGALSFDEKYLGEDCSFFHNNTIENWLANENKFRRAIENFPVKKLEKFAQQEIILATNKDISSKWFVVDMEYSISGISYGRFDMIAISREKVNGKHKIGLIELKSGTGAFGGVKLLGEKIQYGSGVAGHMKNFYEFLYSDKGYENLERLSQEISAIIANYVDLGVDININKIPVDSIDITPQAVECMLICTDIKDEKKSTASLKNYVFDYRKGSSKYNLERLDHEFIKNKYPKLNLKFAMTNMERNIKNMTFELLSP